MKPPFGKMRDDAEGFSQIHGYADDFEQDDELEFIVSGPATGWTEGDTLILEKALDLAGITDAAERLRAEMEVDVMGIVILTPLVKLIEDGQAQLRDYFERIKGGTRVAERSER